MALQIRPLWCLSASGWSPKVNALVFTSRCDIFVVSFLRARASHIFSVFLPCQIAVIPSGRSLLAALLQDQQKEATWQLAGKLSPGVSIVGAKESLGIWGGNQLILLPIVALGTAAKLPVESIKPSIQAQESGTPSSQVGD